MSNKTGLFDLRGGCRLNLLICDDEPAVVEQVSASLRDHCEKSGISAHFYPFSDPGAIKDLSSYDIAFLDIDMGDSSGIDLARTLRRENPGVVIIFLTNFIQYAPEGFEVQAFRYLLKRDMNEKLIPYFEAASKENRAGIEETLFSLSCFSFG